MLHSANLKKQPHRKAPQLCFYRNRNRNEIGASTNSRSNIGVLDIRINLDHNMIHQEGQQWLPAFVRPEDIWSTTTIKEEDLIENVERMRVGCLFKKIKHNRVEEVKEGALSEYRQQLSRTFAPSERRIAPSQVACCRHVLAVRDSADTVLLNIDN